jgi:ABC-type uncharacterized transport system permease subunit
VYPPIHVILPRLVAFLGGSKIYWKTQCNESSRLLTDEEKVPESVSRIVFHAVNVYCSVLARSSLSLNMKSASPFINFLSSYLGVIDSM